MDETTAQGVSPWESWLQSIGGNVLNAWADANYRQPGELEKLRIQASPYGYTPQGRPIAQPMSGPMSGIPPGAMIIGAVLLAVLLLRKAD